MFNLKNKKVIVTGATGGIGNAIIECFYSIMKQKFLATGTNDEKLKLLKDKYNNILTKNLIFQNMMKLKNFIEDSTKILDGNPDILINNAGITRDNLSLRMSIKNGMKF